MSILITNQIHLDIEVIVVLNLVNNKSKVLKKLELFAIKAHKLIEFGEDVFQNFIDSLQEENFDIFENDVIVITSKIFSMQEYCFQKLDDITPSDLANELGEKTKLDPRFVQTVLNETNGEIYGTVYKAILTKTPYGLLANAGMDQSNAPKGTVLILPPNPDNLASIFRRKIKDHFGITVAVLIIDSRTIPQKKGTTGLTIGASGIEPIIDERGKQDLYGYTITITSRAIADNLATAVNLIMGETDERMPYGIIRGADYEIRENVDIKSTMIPENLCLYFSPLISQISDLKNQITQLTLK